MGFHCVVAGNSWTQTYYIVFQLVERLFIKKVLEKHFDIRSSLLLSHPSHNTLLSPSSTIPSRNPSRTYKCGNRIDLVLHLAWKVLSLVLKRLFIINYKNNLTKRKRKKKEGKKIPIPKSPQPFDSSTARKSFANQVEKDISLKETT